MENKNTLKTFFIIVGAVVSIGAIIAVLYTVFKKYFKVTFECDDCDCDCCDGECFAEEEEYEPVCCCACTEETCEAEETANEDEEIAF